MSSKGTLAQKDYTQATIAMGEEYPELVVGYVCQEKLSKIPGIIHVTPGVQRAPNSDSFGQQYLTPQRVITELGSTQ